MMCSLQNWAEGLEVVFMSKEDIYAIPLISETEKELIWEKVGNDDYRKWILEIFAKSLSLDKNFRNALWTFIKSITTIFEESTKQIRSEQKEKVDNLKKEKDRLEESNKTALKTYLISSHIEWIKEVLAETLENNKQQILIINEKIDEMENQNDFDVFCAKIPDILKKTFELATKVLTDKENEHLKEDIYDLIKLTAFELKIKKKKALEIELFWPVRQVLFGGNVVLEAPPGVEPGYEALQAPV